MRIASASLATLAVFAAAAVAIADGDWPQWGGSPSRNMVGSSKGIPLDFNPGKMKDGTEEVDLKTTKNVKWVAKLGSQSYGNPTVAGGRVYLGTNNESPRDPRFKGDRSVVMALDEASGKMVWQLAVPKLGAGKVSDWEFLGICSSPAVDGDRLYVVTNLCEIVCLDTKGMANGNDGPFKTEAAYLGGKGKPAIAPGKTDGDILWRYDMRAELGIFPHNVTSSSVLVIGDYVYATTSNGVDWSHVNIPSPRAPCLIVLNKKTGELVGEEALGISRRIYHCNWSSPSFAELDGRKMILFGAGDGFTYAFAPKPKTVDGEALLQELWRFDCNPPEYKIRDGKKLKYATPPGPSEVIASPVFAEGKVYVTTGQDPEHGEGVGQLSCIDPRGKGDITKTGALWTYKKIHRSISTVSVHKGLVYAADYAGFVHCLDAKTGKLQWSHDSQGHIWSSTLVIDERLYIGNEDGILSIFQCGRKKKLLREVEFDGALYASPIVANNVLYVPTQTHLYAIGK